MITRAKSAANPLTADIHSNCTNTLVFVLRHTMLTPTLTLLLVTLLPPRPVQGGICWAAMVRQGRCTELLEEHVTREKCCSYSGAATAWSPEDLDPGTLFFWRVLGGGVPCHPCKETCKGVECGAGKKCVVRKGQPKCVCSPHCRSHKAGYRGPVCGSDGRTYRSVCKLRRRACRKNNAALTVAYHGVCQSSCARIHCPAGKHCLLDQNLSPHCVHCTRRCAGQLARPVCGVDMRTYHSACHIRQAACRRGKAIPIAYKGKCIPEARCEDIHCSHGQRCLTELHSERPRCVSCPSFPCQESAHKGRSQQQLSTAVTLCGSNNRTYPSWCMMVRDACATGYVIETQSSGHCLADGQPELFANMVSLDNHT